MVLSQPAGAAATVTGNTLNGLTVAGNYTLRYTVTPVAGSGCNPAFDEVTITRDLTSVAFGYTPSQILLPNNAIVQYTPTTPIPAGSSVEWTFEGAVPNFWFLETPPPVLYTAVGNYTTTLRVTTPDGCQLTSTQVVRVQESTPLAMPSAFSPNNDGLNDRFVFGLQGFVSYSFTVFNRWGEVVFASTNPTEFWDGSKQGTEDQAPEGTYVYKFVGITSMAQTVEKNGSITLVR
jgi:gliding motility-associated-like protein